MYKITKNDIKSCDYLTKIYIPKIGARGNFATEDDIQIGRLAMCKAVNGFDPSLGFKFYTFYKYYVKRDLWNAHMNYRLNGYPYHSCIWRNHVRVENTRSFVPYGDIKCKRSIKPEYKKRIHIDELDNKETSAEDRVIMRDLTDQAFESMPKKLRAAIKDRLLKNVEYGDTAKKQGISRIQLSVSINRWRNKNKHLNLPNGKRGFLL